MVAAAMHTQANLLTDPGFDTMSVQEIGWSTTPWWGGGGGGTSSGGGGWITDARSLSPSHSATLFMWGDNWAYAIVAQTIASGVTAGQPYDAIGNFYRTDSIGSATAASGYDGRAGKARTQPLKGYTGKFLEKQVQLNNDWIMNAPKIVRVRLTGSLLKMPLIERN